MVLLELLGVSLFFETFETTHRPFFLGRLGETAVTTGLLDMLVAFLPNNSRAAFQDLQMVTGPGSTGPVGASTW